MKIPLNSRMLERIASLAVVWDGLITSRTANHKIMGYRNFKRRLDSASIISGKIISGSLISAIVL